MYNFSKCLKKKSIFNNVYPTYSKTSLLYIQKIQTVFTYLNKVY